MSLLNVSRLKKSFGEELLFDGVSFEIGEGEHIGLVGVNGSGKTSLFQILIGNMPRDEGEIYQSRETVIGYMEQHVCRNFERTVYDEVLTVFQRLMEMEEQLKDVERELLKEKSEEKIQKLIERQLSLHESYEREGGLTFRNRVRSALLGLGFEEEQLRLAIGVLSGGQKAKLQLAKMLLCGANLLLLDEPTNHLDIDAVEWLEDFLKGFHGSFLVVSHDRYFLDKVTSRTFEIENHKMTLYKGNYTRYLAQKEENRIAAMRQYSNTRKEISRLEGIVAQQRQWNREKNIRTAESKLKMIDRLEKTLEKPEDAPEAIKFRFQVKHTGSNDVLDASELSLAFGEKVLFRHVNMHIRRGERVFLLGPNGCGKTSLLKTILGIYTQNTGTVKTGASVDVGYYDQVQSGLHLEKTVLDELWDDYPQMTQTQVRSALAIFLFHGDDVYKEVASLSGGERARILLLKLMLSQNNFLLLDEPTNHLDITSREALEQALMEYDGTLLVVSHDRYLINKIASRIYYLTEEGAEEYLGNYDFFAEKRRAAQTRQQETVPEERKREKENDYRVQKERRAEQRKLKNRLKETEERIAASELEIKQLEEKFEIPKFAADYEKTMELTARLEEAKALLEELYASWMELNEQLPSEE